jgi:hypothetical protein
VISWHSVRVDFNLLGCDNTQSCGWCKSLYVNHSLFVGEFILLYQLQQLYSSVRLEMILHGELERRVNKVVVACFKALFIVI